MKKIISFALMLILTINLFCTHTSAAEIDNNEDIVVDKIVSEEEYIQAVANYEKIDYDDAKEMIYAERNKTRALPESVVVIHRTIYKNVKSGTEGTWQLMCQVYIEAIRDNTTNDYIGIQAVRAPYVDMVFNNNPLGATTNGTAEATFSGTKVTVYYNGSITYSIKGLNISVDVAPGVSVSGDTGFDVRYSVNTTFVKTI